MVINGYDIQSEIFRGPVTTVFDAVHLSLGRRVILKILNTQWMNETDLIDRLSREAKICARLDHPNIVKIFDFNRTEDSVYISMEYIDGWTLENLIQQRETIEISNPFNDPNAVSRVSLIPRLEVEGESVFCTGNVPIYENIGPC